MKKLLFALIVSILFTPMSVIAQNNAKIQPDNFQSIIPTDLQYEYIEPIKRAKWVYPLAWIGYVGTCFLIPFPIYMINDDNAIAINNKKYSEFKIYEERYYSDIEKCNTLFKNDKDLFKCYQEVKLSHQTFINGVRAGNIQQAQAELQEQQLQAQRYNNYLQQQKNNTLNNIQYNTKYGY